jgi:nicotinamidase/pyrazinamidase
MSASLLVVDAQRGFTEHCPDELPVPGGAALVPAINSLLALPWSRIDASQDWHPPDHCSFLGRRDNLGTPGAEFLPGLHTERFSAIWRKGYQRDVEAYAVTAQHPCFIAHLRESGVTLVAVCGIAINICCFFAARDLRRAGFDVLMVEDACAGIDIPAAGLFQATAKADGQQLGIRYVQAADAANILDRPWGVTS